jgi:hypothetical protein
MTNFTVLVQPVRILDGYQADGATLTNVGATPIYINNNSAVSNINQVIDIGGSMYFEPYTEVWAVVNSATLNGQLTATFDASDRFSNVAPGITYVGTFGMTSAGSSINYAFDIGSSAGSQFQAYKIVLRFPGAGIDPTTSGDYEYVVGANLSTLANTTQTLQSSILMDRAVILTISNFAPAYVIVPLTGATSGTLFITPPANTSAVGSMVMDVYGLTHAPTQLIAWSDPSLTLSSIWQRKGNSWYYEIASVASPLTVFLPAMGANFTIGVTGTNATVQAGQNVVIQTFTTTPATIATKYSWDSTLLSFTAASQVLANQRTYTTTPGLPLAIRINNNGTTMTDIRVWIQNNALIGA